MAGSAVVGALRVTLGLDSAQFSTGMKNAQTGLQRFAGIAKAGALAIGTAMVAAGGAVAVALKGFIDRADELYEVSQSLGVTVEDLTRMQYAADLSGVSAENLEKALRKLSVGLYDATQSATGPAAQAFHALGISATDAAGNIRPTIDVMGDLAKRFETLPDGAAKTALAVKLFGRTGADLIPMLNEGQSGLQGMYEEAERLGVVLDTETAAAAERFNDNLTRLGKTKDGIIAKISAGMLPSLENLSNALVVAASKSGTLNGIGAALGWTIRALATSAVTAGGFFVALARDIAMAAAVAGKWATGDFAGAAASLAVGNAARERTLSGVLAINRAIWSSAGAGGGGGSRPPATVALDSVDSSARRARGSVERLTDAQREAQRAAEEMARDGQRTFEETRTPLEQYTARVEELRRQLAAAAIDQETFNRAMREAQNRRDDQDPLVQAYNKMREDQAEAAADAREDAVKLARDHEEDLRDATFNGISDGLHAAADGNLGQYLAAKLREKLFDGLANVLTNMVLGQPGKSGGGAMGWLSAAGSMLKHFSGGIPGFSKGVENFAGGLAYVHKGEVLANLPKGTSVIPASAVNAGGGGGNVLNFDLRGAVMTEDLLAQMNGMANQAAGNMGRQVLDASRRAAPGLQNRQRLLGTT